MIPELSAMWFPDFVTSPEFALSRAAIQTDPARGTSILRARFRQFHISTTRH
jgi:hypothetical protein